VCCKSAAHRQTYQNVNEELSKMDTDIFLG
jgi:hypothetical protein